MAGVLTSATLGQEALAWACTWWEACRSHAAGGC